MLNTSRWNPWNGAVLVACAVLVGCTPKTNVSATGNVPAQYSNVYMTVKEIWFHTSATAGPDDTAWIKFPLTTPVTVNLFNTAGGTLNQITTGLAVPLGTYAQVRLIPVDSSANSEVDYVDSAGTPQKARLELQNPDKGIGIATTLKITGDTSAVLGTTSTTSTTTTSTSATSQPVLLAINVNGARDLVPFKYNGVTGILLNPHVTAYDTSLVGAIAGTLTLTSLTEITNPSQETYDDIQVTAESLSADGTRHMVVNSAPVSSTGAFVLYPLATSKTSPTSYDLVIHGPSIATIIIKGIPVNVGDSTTPVSVGTITPTATSSPTNSFTVLNVTPATPLPAGALVGFYQTLPGTGEVPYLVEEWPIDPFSGTFFSGTFASDQAISSAKAISSASIDLGTFVSSGSTVTLSATVPIEGASTYRVSATAPLFADGVPTTTTTFTAPTTTSSSAVSVTVPTLTVASGAVPSFVTLSINETTPKKYNAGEVIISHDGAIVATAALDALLAQGSTGTLSIPGLPGGTASGLYYVSVRAWNSTNAGTPLLRETYPQALDMRSGSVTGFAVNID